MLATILALVMALSLCTSAWATSEETSESTGATAGTETGGTGANGTEGGKTSSEENGGQATTYVAQIGEMKYETLQAAVNAASRKATVKLLADTKENVTISTPYVTLDLNGHTLNGSTGERKPALTITARVTVKDSSAEKTGTIMREDTAENSGVSSHYVIDVQGSAEGKVAKVSITGGTVNGTLGTYTYNNGLATTTDAAKAAIEVTGGTFKENPTKYVAENSAITKNSDGTFGVAKTYLAKVGETSYYTMDEAFHAAVASGETLYLLRDYTTGAEQNSGSKSFAIDLDGHTWTYTGTNTNCAAFQINYSDVTLTVKNGTVVSNSMVGLIPSAMGGTITYNNAGLVFENVTMTAKGHSGIETNGNNTNDAVTLKNSTLNVPNGFGIYFPSSGTLTINNSTINAKTMGVQVCAGSLEITGESAITVTGDAVPKTENDGAIQDGAAISVVDRTGYKGLGKVEVKNGSFTAKTDEALKAYKYENKEEGKFDNDDKKLTVTGGTFSSQVPSEYVAADKRVRVDNANSYTIVTNGSITSGTYTEEPTVAPGYKAVQNTDGTWRVEKTSGGYYYYPSTPGITAELNGSNKSATDYPGGEYGLVFRSTAAFSTFQGVQVDGKTLAKSNYTAEEGSTVVYLKAAYLKTLAAGKHTITILSTAGNTSMDFTIGGKSSSPKTFDAGVGIYAVTAVLSVTGMAWTAKKRH